MPMNEKQLKKVLQNETMLYSAISNLSELHDEIKCPDLRKIIIGLRTAYIPIVDYCNLKNIEHRSKNILEGEECR